MDPDLNLMKTMAKFAAEMFAKQNIHSMPELQNYLRLGLSCDGFRGAQSGGRVDGLMNAMTMLSQLADPEVLCVLVLTAES